MLFRSLPAKNRKTLVYAALVRDAIDCPRQNGSSHGIGRNTIVWTHEDSAHTGVGMGSAGLAGAVALSCR